MIVGVVKETYPGERRVALTPHVLPQLAKAGLEVVLETGSGDEAGFPDASYTERGAKVLTLSDAFVFDLTAEGPVQAAKVRYSYPDKKSCP